MTTEQIIGLALALLVMAIGFLGSFVPVIPGAPLVLIAAIGHRIYFGQESAGTFVLILLAAITVISMVLDYVATYYGAKRLGATWRGGIGAAVGGIVGLFFGLPGIIIGPFLGAMLLELTAGYELKKAARAGAGAMLGLLAGAVGKAALCMMMIGLFTLNVIYRSWSRKTTDHRSQNTGTNSQFTAIQRPVNRFDSPGGLDILPAPVSRETPDTE